MSDDRPPKPTDTGRYVAAELAALLENKLGELDQNVRSQSEVSERRLHNRMREQHNVAMRAHAQTRGQIVHLAKGYAELWRTVKGEDPPPMPPADDAAFSQAIKPVPRPPSSPEIKPLHELAKAVSDNDSDIDEVKGHLLRVESIANETLRLQMEQMGRKDTKKEDRRSIVRRAADSVVWAVRDREGQKTVGAVVAAITGILTTALTWYMLLTGRVPMPMHPPAPADTHHRLGD